MKSTSDTITKKSIGLFLFVISFLIVKSVWLQHILEHITGTVVHLAVCALILLTLESLTPESSGGLSLFVLSMLQCLIWIF